MKSLGTPSRNPDFNDLTVTKIRISAMESAFPAAYLQNIIPMSAGKRFLIIDLPRFLKVLL